MEELKKYNAWYAADTDEKKIYLTFDAGYDNGNMPAILNALHKHQVHATFFVVGTLIREKPELIREIVDAGHTIGNHTMTHPDMSGISTKEAFQKQLEDVKVLYKEATGKEMTKFYRPPQGIYSVENLEMAKEMGYHTFFWSLAYVDWYQDKQPSKKEAFEKLLGRIHPGAIVLLHSTSSTNASILDELLTNGKRWIYLRNIRRTCGIGIRLKKSHMIHASSVPSTRIFPLLNSPDKHTKNLPRDYVLICSGADFSVLLISESVLLI